MTTKKIRTIAVALAVLGLWAAGFLAAGTQQARAGLVTVVGDVNAASSLNFPLYDNVLGSGVNVLFSRDDAQQGAIQVHYNTLAGVTAVDSAATLESGALAGIDLLVVTRFFNAAMDYSAAEIAAVGAYVAAGGSVLLIAEGYDFLPASLNGYNAFLSGIGSSIRYNLERYSSVSTVSPVEATSLTVGVTQFSTNIYNTLSGGIAAVNAPEGAIVAFEDVGAVPAPGTLAVLGFGLAGLVAARRRRQ